MRRKTLDDVYRSYMGDVYRYIVSLCHDHYLAEDIMQDTFYRAYLYLEECHVDKVKPWLFRVAYNAFVDHIRKEKRKYPMEDELLEKPGQAKTPEDAAVINDEIREIYNIIAMLPEKQKQAVLLCDFNGFSYKEAADYMKVGLAYFKVLLFRARQRIRENGREGNG